jgi:hypothetical protein
MGSNAIFNNLFSYIVVEETIVPGEKTTVLPQVNDKLYHIKL